MNSNNNSPYIPDISQIKKDLEIFQDQAVILYGSFIKGDFLKNRSDIDIAIISFSNDKNINIQLWKNIIGKVSTKYDLRIFELFPLYIQIDIIQNYFVLYGDHLDISEYFYPYRVKWDEMVFRIEENRFKNSNEKKIGLLRQKVFQSNDLISN